jgi:hypothetical protein
MGEQAYHEGTRHKNRILGRTKKSKNQEPKPMLHRPIDQYPITTAGALTPITRNAPASGHH